LLAGQWPSIESQLTDALAHVLRFENAAAFRDTVPAHLRILSGNLQRAAAQPIVVRENDFDGRPALAKVPSTGHQAKRRPRRQLIFGLFALAISAGTVAYATHYFRQFQSAGGPVLDKSAQRAVSPVAPSVSAPMAEVVKSASASAPGAAASGVDVSASAISGPAASSPAAATPSTASDAMRTLGPQATSRALIEEKAQHTRLEFGVNRVGAAIVSATVATETEKSRLLETLDRGLGAAHYTADLTIDAKTASADWLAHVEALVPLMRIARADLMIDGQNIELGGAAREPGLGWLSRIQGVFGPAYRVSLFDPVEAVSAATAAFKLAVGNQRNAGSCDSVDRVLNLQVIDFARGSGHVPVTATGNLDETAQLLKTCAARGQTIALTIESFSDNIGEPKANLDLSAKRAEAVRAFLIQAGVPAASLSARGYGVAQPVADNLTERGRFVNRRVVFAVGNVS
jgi:outer membrane protein OmpA-like peptidoglycan-associated protein